MSSAVSPSLSPSHSTGVSTVARSARLAALRADLLAAPYELCTEKASLMTEYLAHTTRSRVPRWLECWHYRLYQRGLADQERGVIAPRWKTRFNTMLMSAYQRIDRMQPADWQLAHAKALRHTLENMTLRVYEHELLVGNPSSQRIGAPLHPDYGGLLLLPELNTLDSRHDNPIEITLAQRRALEQEIFPYWFRRSVLATTPLYAAGPDLIDKLTDGRAFVLTQFAGISHVTPDYPSVLTRGFAGIADSIRRRAAALERQIERQPRRRPSREQQSQRTFLQAALIAAEAAIAYGDRWRTFLTAEATRAADPARRAELRELAELFERVPARPAETFHEALQSVFIAHVLVHQESFQHGVSFGRMDQYLLPYYERDLAAGRLTRAHAVELVGCFLGKAAELLPLFFGRATEFFSGLSSASGITLGGQTPEGGDAVNELSFVFLDAYDQMRLRQPNIHVRLHAGTPWAFRVRCYEVLKKGGGIPALFNDDRVIDSQREAGVPIRDARDYSIVGCAEWGVPYRSFPAAGAGFLNMAYALHLALHDGRDGDRQMGPATGAPSALTSMEAVYSAFERQLERLIADATDGNNAIERAHARHRPTPLLSVMVDGCIDAAREVNAGGAIYNTSGLQGVGLADVADSLAAIERVVFGERRISLTALVEALDDDFVGSDALRARLLNRVETYGEDSGDADRHVTRVSGLFARMVAERRNLRSGHYSPGFWTMTTHQGFGRRLGALPSGRRAGKPLANGISPRTGRERRGPTAALSSAARVASVSNGCVLNQELHPDFVDGDRGTAIIDGLVRGYFAQGGMQLQLQIMDPAVLIDAKAHPDQHRDLVVRISGYSAYFNDLTEAMKDELITRTAHGGTCCG